MPLSSMTGFARASFEVDGARYSWELKSVNARGLEIRLRLPPGHDHLEPDMRTRIRDGISRGSCFAVLQKEADGGRLQLVLNEQALELVLVAARRLAAVEGVAMPTADGLLAIPGVLQEVGSLPEAEGAERRDAAVLGGLDQGIAALKSARVEEGARLHAIVEMQVTEIARLTGEAASVAADAPETLKERIRGQVALLTADANGLDPDRLHQEALLAATRMDVREEIDRLTSHVTGARALLGSEEEIGRRLEFLAQEFNREANTLCAKAFDRRLTNVGIELKAVIDQLREQAQNLA